MRVDIDELNQKDKNKDKKTKPEDSNKEVDKKLETAKSDTTDTTVEASDIKKEKAKKSNKSESVETAKDSEESKKSKKQDEEKVAQKKSEKVETPKAKSVAKPKTSRTIKVAILDEDDKKPKKTKKSEMKLPVVRKIHIRIGYLIFAILLILAGAFFTKVAIWENNYLAAKEGSERIPPESHSETFYETVEGEEVDETKPSEVDIQAYTVAPEKPRFLTIPSIRVYNARINEIGVRNNGELATPTNIYNIGWYTGSSIPGERGASVMDAHGGNQGVGVFKDLPKLKSGDTITVEMGDGRIFNYRVADVVTKQLGDDANNYMPTAFSSPDGSTSSLTLITCTGEWSQRLQTYTQRLFVRAVLES